MFDLPYMEKLWELRGQALAIVQRNGEVFTVEFRYEDAVPAPTWDDYPYGREPRTPYQSYRTVIEEAPERIKKVIIYVPLREARHIEVQRLNDESDTAFKERFIRILDIMIPGNNAQSIGRMREDRGEEIV